ncbi:protein FAR1-RELATED SEQUENCE 5-like [Beta vulgaris subsp. vulgaris]|uniref:protein FAR1-RELATED SEQUENCE 5-like n=1 Tax=Beta vulgaris subsp. vulgaris TaxID=3555 RepID=UPI0025498B42|nr:protein FAR1-RELATED SEQUENCE 5-like [Beta vulgaris subsp. vulgaris]
MTDQDAAMAKAISIVFPNVIHRLCIWHIGKNSINNIKGLRGKAGFVDLFNYVLKIVRPRVSSSTTGQGNCTLFMITKYKCAACPWLIRLYKLRKMWCPVYSKDYFSGGVLSSQRSETTNHSLNQRLHSMQGLCNFYKVFIDVVEEWRDRENCEDYNALNGNKHLAFVDVKLLNEAKKIYTVAVYLTFEENFIRGASFCQKLVKYDPPFFEYHVGRTEKEYLMHLVRYDQENMTIDCTCKYFTEMGLLCSHSLRIFHIHNVEKIPQRYILGRWAKHAMCTRVDDDVGKDVNIVQASVWRVQTTRDALSIINSTQHDIAARKVVENALSDLKAKVGLLIGKVDESITIDDVQNLLYPVVKDPPKKRKKGTRNVRLKSTVEKQVNRLRGWKKTAEKAALRNKAKAQKSVQNKSLLDVYGPDDHFPINHIPGEGSKVEQPHHKAALEVYHEYSEKLFGN